MALRKSVNRWQHYVPVGYQQFWDPDGPRRQESFVYRTNLATESPSTRVPVASICAHDFTYSTDGAAEQQYFDRIDGELPEMIRRTRAGDFADTRTQLALFCGIVMLFARSPAFENHTSADRLRTLTVSWLAITKQLLKLPSLENLPHFGETAVSSFCSSWRMTLLVSLDAQLVTSTNPALMLQSQTGREVWCPIGPAHCVAFHPKAADLRLYGDALSARPDIRFLAPVDVHNLNALQVLNSDGVLLSSEPLTTNRLVALRQDHVSATKTRARVTRPRQITHSGLHTHEFPRPMLTPGAVSFRRSVV